MISFSQKANFLLNSHLFQSYFLLFTISFLSRILNFRITIINTSNESSELVEISVHNLVALKETVT